MINNNTLISFKPLHYYARLMAAIIIFTFLSGCMMMGMHGKKRSAENEKIKPEPKSEPAVIDSMLQKAVIDLGDQEIAVKTIAVWPIEVGASGFDSEGLRRQLINKLVNKTSFSVVSRGHLEELMAEQSLSLSGSLDSRRAVSVGGLIGVDAFVTGYLNKNNGYIKLDLSLVNSATGEIVWSFFKNEKL